MEPEGLVGFGSESQGAHHQTQPTSQLALMTFSRGCTTKPTTSIGPFWLSCRSGTLPERRSGRCGRLGAELGRLTPRALAAVGFGARSCFAKSAFPATSGRPCQALRCGPQQVSHQPLRGRGRCVTWCETVVCAAPSWSRLPLGSSRPLGRWSRGTRGVVGRVGSAWLRFGGLGGG